jgi:hypothetical protein
MTHAVSKEINANIDQYLRLALNQAYVLITKTSGSPVTLEQAKEYVRSRLVSGPGPSPAAWKFQAKDFPFTEGSGGWIGEELQSLYPEVYQRVGDEEER